MNFAEGKYGVFLFVVFTLFWMLRNRKAMRHMMLLLGSYFFYAQWNFYYLGLIVFSSLLDFNLGRLIYRAQDARRRKLYLICSLVGNLGVLAAFKYFNFFAGSGEALLAVVGLDVATPTLHVLLPVGISFYTFQTLSYTIDIYRGKLEPTDSVLDFSLFVGFFPQLVAGPIVRASYFLPQLEKQPVYDDDQAVDGIYLILKGLTKKIIIADFLGRWLVEAAFEDPGAYHGLRVLIGVYAYAFQIYGDFSGYTDVAIGSAKMLGFNIPINFNRPYLATDLQDFWRRWHISLSTWLRDYLYIPLGGSRCSNARTYANLLITMVLGGLWHGANWTFVVWGTLHGGALAITRMVQRSGLVPSIDLPPWADTAVQTLKRFATFHLVCLGWVFFRSPTFGEATDLLRSLTTGGSTGLDHPYSVGAVGLLLLAAAAHFTPKSWDGALAKLFQRTPVVVKAVIVVFAIALFSLFSDRGTPFIYFQF